MTLKRISSGIPGLDEVLFGGLIKGRTYLLVGLAGTGKTIFTIQWMQDGASQREKCLYITPQNQLKRSGSTSQNLAGSLMQSILLT